MLTRGVFVLGMHRSGTSVATRIASLVGLSLGQGPLVPPTEGNPRGHWESAVLRDVNDDLLARLGGSWTGPPPLDDDWEHDACLDAARPDARAAFARVYGPAPRAWVWKDPRNCITLPFWEHELGVEAVVLLVYRNPLAVADSLLKRDELSRPVSLALWERYVRESLRNSGGRRVLIASCDEIADDPVAWAGRVRDVLGAAAGELGPGSSDDAISNAVDASLYHAPYTGRDLGADPQVTEAQRALFDVLEKVAGSSDCFVVPALPALTPGLDRLLAEHARFYDEREKLRAQLTRAREYDQRIVNVRRLKIRTYALYRRFVSGGRRG